MKKRKDGYYQKKVTFNGTPKIFYGKSLAEINKKITAYQTGEQKKKTPRFDYVAEMWAKEHAEEIPYSTWLKCGRREYTYAKEYFGKQKIENIYPDDISEYLKHLARKDYSQKTVSAYRNILSQIFRYAKRKRYIESNPVDDVRTPRNLPKNPRHMPSDDIIDVVNQMTSGFEFIAYFLLYTGLRKSEALALTYDDIDRKRKTITVNKRVVYERNNPSIVQGNKTEAGTRTVILLDRVLALLPEGKTGYIFGNSDGSLITKRQEQCRWEKIQKKYGIKFTAHQLRHAYATMLFEAGISEKDAQSLMGHSDIHITHQIYTDIREKRNTLTAQKLNDFNF